MSLLLALCVFLGFFGEQRYYCDAVEVESIFIVELGEIVEGEYQTDDTVISEITDISGFVSRLNSLNYSINSGEPTVLNTGDVLIKINYQNGDFDLVNHYAQSFYRSGKWRTGFFFFDKVQFDSLIGDYTTNTEGTHRDGSKPLKKGQQDNGTDDNTGDGSLCG